MSESYDYKPPLGFDIRIKPDTEKEPEPHERGCNWPGCTRPAVCRAPAAPDRLNEFRWFCQDHARKYNQSWNYFSNMNDDEIAAFQVDAATGHRPTWSMGCNGWSHDRAFTNARAEHFQPGRDKPGNEAFRKQKVFADAFDVTGQDADQAVPGEDAAKRRRVSKLQAGALADLGLDDTATLNDVKTRYKELVKRFHPDANGGDRRAEGSLGRVIRAYQTLKSSGFR